MRTQETSTRHCEECGAALDPAKILRCTKCKACFYCSAACQKRNWTIHKRVCSTDPALRPFMPVEMAIERALAKQPKAQKAPKDAFCYICLEGDGKSKSSKLMRGCACHGDSAGFVHLECLTEHAMNNEASGDPLTVLNSWKSCINCKQTFQGALKVEMKRRFWRHHRSSQDLGLRYDSSRSLVFTLSFEGELDAAMQVLDEASNCVRNNRNGQAVLLELELLRADILSQNGQNLEALGLLQAMLPEAKMSTAQRNYQAMQQMTEVLIELGRYQEAHETAAEAFAFTKAKFGLEDHRTLIARSTDAIACVGIGRKEEAKIIFEDVLTTRTRVVGRDHSDTQQTRTLMRSFGFAVPSG